MPTWKRIIDSVIETSKKLPDKAKTLSKSTSKSTKEALLSKVKDKSYVTDTYKGVPYSKLDTKNALIPVGGNSFSTKRNLDDISFNEILAQLVHENPKKTLAGVGGLGLLATSLPEDEYDPENELQKQLMIASLQKQGLSDEQIDQYLTSMEGEQ